MMVRMVQHSRFVVSRVRWPEAFESGGRREARREGDGARATSLEDPGCDPQY